MNATALLAEALAAGIEFRLDGANVRLSAAREPAPALLARLRERKAELAALLKGEACRRCGGTIVDRGPEAWVPFADGTAAHLACEDRWYVEDALRRAGNAYAASDEDESA